MKIAILNFPVNDVGGINSWIENFQVGCRTLGHEANVYYVSGQGKLGVDPHRKQTKTRSSLLAAYHLSMRDDMRASDTISHLKGYDLIVFGHTSPHPTKANESSIQRRWQRLYSELPQPKITVFHDDRWERNNQWLSEVETSNCLAVAAQHKFHAVTKKWAEARSLDHVWEYFPLQVPREFTPFEPKHYGIIFTQWVGMKNHRKFLPMLPKMPDPIHFYGNGVEYTYARKDGDLAYYDIEDLTEFGRYRDDSHVFFGFVPYEDVLEALRYARYAIDLSANGYTNMSHWEPLMYGVPSLVHNDTFYDNTCELPLSGCIPYNGFENLPAVISTIDKYATLTDRRRGYEFVRDHCSCELVSKRLIERAVS